MNVFLTSESQFLHFSVIVTKGKFVCLTHSEAKQTDMLEFGAEGDLLQGHARRWCLVPKKP